MASLLERDAARPGADHDDPRRPALRHGDGGDRRVPDLRRLQPRLADLYLDDVHVRPGLPSRPLAPGLRGGHRHDRRGRHDDRHGRPAVALPAERLTKPMAQQAIPRDVTLTPQGWFQRNRSATARPGGTNPFNLSNLPP